MGILIKTGTLSLNMATVIFVPLIGASIYAGQYIPFDLQSILASSRAPKGFCAPRKSGM